VSNQLVGNDISTLDASVADVFLDANTVDSARFSWVGQS